MSMIIQPDPEDPYRLCRVTVDDARRDRLAGRAVNEAAVYLDERPEDLYAAEVRDPVPLERSRFRPNLDVPAPVLKWTAVVIVRLRPDVVENRRGRLPGAERKHLRPVTSRDDE